MKVRIMCMVLVCWALCAASAFGLQIRIWNPGVNAGSSVSTQSDTQADPYFAYATAMKAETGRNPWTGEWEYEFDGSGSAVAGIFLDGRSILMRTRAYTEFTSSSAANYNFNVGFGSAALASLRFNVEGGLAEVEWWGEGLVEIDPSGYVDSSLRWTINRVGGPGGYLAGATNVPGPFGPERHSVSPGGDLFPITYEVSVGAMQSHPAFGVLPQTFSTALEADVHLRLRFLDPTNNSLLLVSESPVAASHQVDTPAGPFDFSFSHLFETTTGQLQVLLGGTEVARIDAPARLPSEFQRETLRIDDPALLGRSDVPLAFVFDGPTGSRVIADEVVFPGLLNGDFTGPAPVAHQVDTPAEAFDFSFSYLFENNFTRQPEGRLQVFLDGTEVARVDGLGVRQWDFQTETVRIDDPALLGLSDVPLAFVFEAAYNNDVFVRNVVFPGVEDGDFTGLYPIRARDQSDFSGWTAVAGSPTLDYTPIRIVPEPSALGLLISGAIGLLAYAWRKRWRR